MKQSIIIDVLLLRNQVFLIYRESKYLNQIVELIFALFYHFNLRQSQLLIYYSSCILSDGLLAEIIKVTLKKYIGRVKHYQIPFFQLLACARSQSDSFSPTDGNRNCVISVSRPSCLNPLYVQLLDISLLSVCEEFGGQMWCWLVGFAQLMSTLYVVNSQACKLPHESRCFLSSLNKW